MNKNLPVLVALALAAVTTWAREISSEEAGRAAAAWARRDGSASGARLLSAGVADVRTAADDDGTPIFHVVRLPGGGVVVTSAESGVTPVVAFLESGDLQESDGNPLWKILRADLTLRTRQARTPSGGTRSCASETAWANLLAANSGGARLQSAIPDASGLSDLRVAPLISTTWEQGGNAANYYTPPGTVGDPDNYVCGCVALAGAQIANYWRFPTLSRPQVTNLCYLSGVSANYVSLGGFYDWSNMPARRTSPRSPSTRSGPSVGSATTSVSRRR